MATIEINNIYSRIVESPAAALAPVYQALSVKVPGHEYSDAYKSGRWDGMHHFFNMQSKKFPTGLLTEVYMALKRKGYVVKLIDKRKVIDVPIPEDIELGHLKLGSIKLSTREYQLEGVQKALNATRGIIRVATNGGKTEMACGIIKSILPYLSPKETIGFFTHNKEIFMQSKARIECALGIEVGEIGMEKWEPKQVNLIMIPTLSKYMEKPKDIQLSHKRKKMINTVEQLKALATIVDPEKKKEVMTRLSIAKADLKAWEEFEWKKIYAKVTAAKELTSNMVCVIADEVHHASSDTWYEVLMGIESAYFRFGLTGTIDETKVVSVKKLHACTGREIINISNKFLIERGFSAEPTVHLLPIITAPIKGVDDKDARRLGIIENVERNQTFVDKILEKAKEGKQCLVIVNEIEHGDIIFSMLDRSGITVRFSHGQRPNKFRIETLDMLKNKELDVLIATSILDEGVDVPNINCLFLMAGFKDMRALLQRIGRGLRVKDDGSGLEVYDAMDHHNEYLLNHTMERQNTYKAEGFKIVKLD